MEKDLVEFWRPSGMIDGFDNHEIEKIASELFEKVYSDKTVAEANLEQFVVPIAAKSLGVIYKNELFIDYNINDALSELTPKFVVSEAKKLFPLILGMNLNFFDGFKKIDIDAETCVLVAKMIAHKAILKSKKN